jgi:hypothetical protein
MTLPNLSFVSDGRDLEIEAVEGGRSSSEFTLAPPNLYGDAELQDSDQIFPFGQSSDEVELRKARVDALRVFIDYARTAYRQRGLVYPFFPSASRDALEILPGHQDLAKRSAELSYARSTKGNLFKDFEVSGFKTLHKLVGGWGVCVGAPRCTGGQATKAIDKFRSSLNTWERGSYCPDLNSRSTGDLGADGIMILGRSWGGPILFYQAKNTDFDPQRPSEEFSRMPAVLKDWFGRNFYSRRWIIPVLALNTVLTLEMKEEIAEGRGGQAVHMLDAVDILCAEFVSRRHNVRRSYCKVF